MPQLLQLLRLIQSHTCCWRFSARRALFPAPTATGTFRRTGGITTMASAGASAGALPLARVRLHAVDGADPTVSIQLEVDGKQRTFNRPANAPLDATLRRMQLSLAKRNKAKKPKEERGTGAVATLRDRDGNELAQGLTNAEAWDSGTVLQLQGFGAWRVEACLPHVVSLHVPGASRPMVGFTLRPIVRLEFADAPSDCQWCWSRTSEVGEELILSAQQEYTPSENDAGHALRVCCFPTRDGSLHPDSIPAELVTGRVTTSRIEGAPVGLDIVKLRSTWTAASCTNSHGIRVMCYNILANVYGNTSEAREELFP